MSITHKVVGQEENEGTVIEWSLHVDDDGHLQLSGNGEGVLFVSGDGRFYRFYSDYASQVSGLKYDEEGLVVFE